MKAPIAHKHGKLTYWDLPDKEWLEDQYHTQGKSAAAISRELGTFNSKVTDWLSILDISTRTKKERDIRHSERMSGDGNPAWVGGHSRRYHNLLCIRAGIPCVCSWCGEEGELRPGRHETSAPTCRLHLHHIDHNKANGEAENLMYLCFRCHMLETAAFKLHQAGKAQVSCSGKVISIDFNQPRRLR